MADNNQRDVKELNKRGYNATPQNLKRMQEQRYYKGRDADEERTAGRKVRGDVSDDNVNKAIERGYIDEQTEAYEKNYRKAKSPDNASGAKGTKSAAGNIAKQSTTDGGKVSAPKYPPQPEPENNPPTQSGNQAQRSVGGEQGVDLAAQLTDPMAELAGQPAMGAQGEQDMNPVLQLLLGLLGGTAAGAGGAAMMDRRMQGMQMNPTEAAIMSQIPDAPVAPAQPMREVPTGQPGITPVERLPDPRAPVDVTSQVMSGAEFQQPMMPAQTMFDMKPQTNVPQDAAQMLMKQQMLRRLGRM